MVESAAIWSTVIGSKVGPNCLDMWSIACMVGHIQCKIIYWHCIAELIIENNEIHIIEGNSCEGDS